jgi:hypothetical protein
LAGGGDLIVPSVFGFGGAEVLFGPGSLTLLIWKEKRRRRRSAVGQTTIETDTLKRFSTTILARPD